MDLVARVITDDGTKIEVSKVSKDVVLIEHGESEEDMSYLALNKNEAERFMKSLKWALKYEGV